MTEQKGIQKSYGIKETYVTPLNKCLMACQEAIRNFSNVTPLLVAEYALIASFTRDLKKEFKQDAENIIKWLLEEPAKATGITRAIRAEHAMQLIDRVGFSKRIYAWRLYWRITDALDEKNWLDKAMREVPRNW